MMYDSRKDIEEHIVKVQLNLDQILNNLQERGRVHDKSKLTEPEKVLFDKYTPLLRDTTYGSEQYKHYLEEMGVALQHHYEVNDHHPEHYASSISDMSLMAILEMLSDWKAASERHADGDFLESLRINRDRFDIEDFVMWNILNTCVELGWIEEIPPDRWWLSVEKYPNWRDADVAMW